MASLHQFVARVFGLFRRSRAERDFDHEIGTHLDLAIDARVRGGMTPQEARTDALRALGGIEQARELSRDQRGLPQIESFVRDIVHAWRVIRARPLLSASAVIAIALGVGANIGVFSIAYGILWRPLPYAEPDRLVRLYQSKADEARIPVSPLNYQDWHRLNTSLDRLAAWREWVYQVRVTDGQEPTPGARVSASLFQVLGIEPAIGRAFREDEDTPGGPLLAVISDALWRTRYGGRADIVGRSISTEEEVYTIIGVLPPGIGFPTPETAIWTPLRLGDASHRMIRTERYLSAIGRLKGNVTLAQARLDLDRVASVLSADWPQANAGTGMSVIPLKEVTSGDARVPLMLLLGVAGAVLLIAVANVAHVLMAQASARRKELTLRAALGATRGRLLRQSLAEACLLALGGGLLGLIAARVVIEALRATLPDTLPRRDDIVVDGVAVAYAFGCTLIVAVLCAIAPAMLAWRVNLEETLRSSRPTAAAGSSVLGRVVILLQVALSLVLLTSTLLMVQSLRNILSVEAGFDPGRVVVVPLSLPNSYFSEGGKFQSGRVIGHYEQVVERVSQLPRVEAAGLVNHIPLGGDLSSTRFTIQTRPPLRPEDVPTANYRVVSPTYFRTMRAQLVKGRYLTASDREETMAVCMINETAAKRFWRNEDPVGSRIRRGGLTSKAPYLTIVGVVADMKQEGLDRDVKPEIFMPHTQFPWPAMMLVVRTPREMQALMPELRATLLQVNAAQAIQPARELADVVWATLQSRVFTSLVLSLSSLLAVILALLGVYAIMAYATSRRTREIAIRLALGGRPVGILRAVIGQTIGLVLFGLCLGAIGAYAVARLIATQLYGVAAFDAPTYLVSAAVLVLVATLAALSPARRALRVDPLVTLRVE